MPSSVAKLLFVCLVTGFLLIAPAPASPTGTPVDPNTSLKDQGLLQKYIEISAQSMPERMQAMRKLSATERSSLWRLHLGIYLTKHSSMSIDQRALVLDTLSIATPETLELPGNKDPNTRAKALEALQNLTTRALQLFPKEEAAQFLSNLGGNEQDGDSVRRYVALSELTRPERKAVFAQASSREKSDLWRVHLGIQLARHPEWNQQQRDLVLDVAATVSAELYDVPKDRNWENVVGEPLRVLGQRAIILFGKAVGGEILNDLGGKPPAANHVRRVPEPPCDCSRQSDWCTWDCFANACQASTWGCGTLFAFPCDAMCYHPPQGN